MQKKSYIDAITILNDRMEIVLNEIMTRKSERNAITLCNGRKRDGCPLSESCLTEYIIYQASVTRLDSNKKETDIGLWNNIQKEISQSQILL